MWKEYQLKIDDLKQENMNLKKQVNELMSTINVSKVKIRKLETECKKKDKEIYVLMDPKNPNCKIFQQRICENGANFIIRLKRENEKLRKDSTEKDMIINRLNSELRATNVYRSFDKDKRKIDGESQKKTNEIDQNLVASEKMQIRNNLDIHKIGTYAKQDNNNLAKVIKSLECKELEKLYTNLQKIKENMKHNIIIESDDGNTLVKMHESNMKNNIDSAIQTHVTDSTLSSSDFEFSCDTPHEEIQKLENYFLEMFTEVDDLKLIINQLQKEQEKISEMCLNEKCVRKYKRQKKKSASQDNMKKTTKMIRKSSSHSIKTLDFQCISEESLEDDSERSSIKSNFNTFSDYVEISQEISRHYEA